ELYGKIEGANPTGSFKDRGKVFAVAKAIEDGSQCVICASTGNTSATAAAYATRAGIQSIVVIPKGKVALGKLGQATMYGAKIIEIDGNFDDALNIVHQVSETTPLYAVNSVN
ncbi:pyridoxal-phosphate dependent enzyme, partial [Lysinibacillus fusiformis]|uniref:pyridoxal-phosphate dependent enzyme n=1 Tax=Lysinibacillus fusiformis TaxID=28031 RepID=UPI0020BE94C9